MASAMRNSALPDPQHFFGLHDQALVGPEVVRAVLGGISDTSLWRLISAGTVPEPIRMARHRRWHVGEIKAVLERMRQHWPSERAKAAA